MALSQNEKLVLKLADEIVDLVAQMRLSQAVYFRTKTSEALTSAKNLEKSVDLKVKNYQKAKQLLT